MISMNVGVAGVGRGQLVHRLDATSRDMPGGEMPYKAKLCPPGDKETKGKVSLWCSRLGAQGSTEPLPEQVWAVETRQKGPFQLKWAAPF